MASIDLVLPFRARPWMRPGATTRGGHAALYTKSEQREYMAQVVEAWQKSGLDPLPRAPYRATLTCHFARPDRHFKRDGSLSAEGKRYPFPIAARGYGDGDNLLKVVLDALVEAGAIPDDALCVDPHGGAKLWLPRGYRDCARFVAQTIEVDPESPPAPVADWMPREQETGGIEEVEALCAV